MLRTVDTFVKCSVRALACYLQVDGKMQLWLASLGALFLFYLGNHGAGSCGCYGPASSPDKGMHDIP